MVPNVAGSNPVIRPRIKKVAVRRFFFILRKDKDENRRKSRSNRSKKADGSMPVCKADFTRWRSNPSRSPRIKKVAVRRFFLFCERIRMRTCEKAGRTTVKRQTEVCRSAKQILQGGEAIRAEAPATVGLFLFPSYKS